MPRQDVPAPPSNTAVGGKATPQPERTPPVSDRETEAIILLGGCFSYSSTPGTRQSECGQGDTVQKLSLMFPPTRKCPSGSSQIDNDGSNLVLMYLKDNTTANTPCF